MLRFFIILTALGAGPAAMAQHILEPLEQGDYEALEGPPNADRAGISFFPNHPSGQNQMGCGALTTRSAIKLVIMGLALTGWNQASQ